MTGVQTCALPISLSAPVQISVTTLVGNEAPKNTAISNKAPGVIVSIDCSDPTITFPNGITLTFKLPFTQRPGSAMQVVTYNETTNHWDTFTDAIVSSDGKSAHVTIYHFSIWGVNVPLTFTHQDVSISAPVITPYSASIEWSSMIDFKEGIPIEIDDYSMLYGKVESSTGLSFASYQISGTLSTISTVKNRISITEASASNPAGFGNFAPRKWELVKYIYTVKGIVSFPIFDFASNMDVLRNVNCWYEMPAYVWLWRPDETFTAPTNPALAHDVVTITPIILGTQHQGGSGS